MAWCPWRLERAEVWNFAPTHFMGCRPRRKCPRETPRTDRKGCPRRSLMIVRRSIGLFFVLLLSAGCGSDKPQGSNSSAGNDGSAGKGGGASASGGAAGSAGESALG